MIKKLAELAKEEGVVLDYYIGTDDAMTSGSLLRPFGIASVWYWK